MPSWLKKNFRDGKTGGNKPQNDKGIYESASS